MLQSLQVVIIKPSKYLADGHVERFRRGFMPNSTVPYIRSMVTWRHPHLSRQRLSEMLFECYREFFSFRHSLHNLRQQTLSKRRESCKDKLSTMAMTLFVRYCAWRRTHPMSGGVMRVQRDCAGDYLSLRRRTFDCELAPLPRSLALPVAEQLLTPERHLARAGADRLSVGLDVSPESSL
jgi:hypothetical protein